MNGYSPSEYLNFKNEVSRLQKLTLPELKNMLKKNDQYTTGCKDQIVCKVADGITLGKIPRCKKCFGGKYYFDYIGRSIIL